MDNELLKAGIEQAREASGEMAAAARAMARSRARQARYGALAALAGFVVFTGFWIGVAVGKWYLFAGALLLLAAFFTAARRAGKRHAAEVVQLGAALHEASSRAQALINEAAAPDQNPDSAPSE